MTPWKKIKTAAVEAGKFGWAYWVERHGRRELVDSGIEEAEGGVDAARAAAFGIIADSILFCSVTPAGKVLTVVAS